MSSKKLVHTSIDEDLHKLAKKKRLSWQECLEAGIKSKLSLKDEKELLLKELNLLHIRMTDIHNRINDIDKMQLEVQEINLDWVIEQAKKVSNRDNFIEYEYILGWANQLDMLPHELTILITQELPGVKI